MSTGSAAETFISLPEAEESPKCSEFSKSICEDPGGTAFAAAAVILIEVPLPWPKPIFKHSLLANWTSESDFWIGKSRVLAAVPKTNSENIQVTIFERTLTGANTFKHSFTSSDELDHFRQYLMNNHPDEMPGIEKVKDNSVRSVLVCTQGSHDICCGSYGTRFAEEVEQNVNGIDVYRVSHTGGHRFAPTAMTLPDGRMWAGLNSSLLESIMEPSGNAIDFKSHCRGWWGASPGPEQIAERAILAKVGWALNDLPRNITVREIPGGWIAEVGVSDKTWEVKIKKRRVVPSISCRSDGGLPTKLHTEYLVTSVHEQHSK
tara:strand:+ start:12179 stop:13135 length:957 start_codon:yes stop_codon:yes gene_type:complete